MDSSGQRCISFAEIVKGRDASVRITDDGLLYAVDLAMVVTGKNRNDAGKTLRNLKEVVFQSGKFNDRYLSLTGGHPTKLITCQDAIQLIMVLPGSSAKHVRKHIADIIVRYLDGDTSMCIEINANREMGRVQSYSNFACKLVKEIDDQNAKEAYKMPPTCYIYATKSAAFPGLVKIGKTEDINRRLSQLNTSCAPAPHVVVALAPTLNQSRDEKLAHTFFADMRREGEFFELEDDEVKAFFDNHIAKQYHIELVQNISMRHGMNIE